MRKKNSIIHIFTAIALLLGAIIVFLTIKDPEEKNGRINGYVADSLTGKMVAGVDVSAENEEGKEYTDYENNAATRQDGFFSIELPPGTYTIHFKAAGYKDLISESYIVEEEKTTVVKEVFLLEAEAEAGNEAGDSTDPQAIQGVVSPENVTAELPQENPGQSIGEEETENSTHGTEQDSINVQSPQDDSAEQATGTMYNTKGQVRILNKNVTQKAGFERLANRFQEETGIHVTIETPRAGAYSSTLDEKLTRSPQDPTLFMLGGVSDFKKYSYECLNISNYPVTGQLTHKAYSLQDENSNIFGIACNIEAFGIAVNTHLLEEAGFTASDIRSFSDLKRIAEDITSRKTQLGFSAFTSPSIGSKADGSYRFSLHAPTVPLYYEVKDNGFNMTLSLHGTYMKCYKEYVNLYLNNSTISKVDAVSGSLEEARQEFCNGKAVFHQDGSWDADVLPHNDIVVIPIFMGIPEEQKQGLCKTCTYYWCVNKFASEDDIEATLQFLNWIVTSEEGLSIMRDEMKMLIPYRAATAPDNVFLQTLYNQEQQGKTLVEQFYKYGNYSKWEESMNRALDNYLIREGSWDEVTEAFTSLW